tara:strand:+ start:181 stop:354 length:174 start_codon:yes stop_codon:yes gene_type:complete
MNLQSKLPDTLNKIISKFLEKHKSINKETFMKILEFVYKEGSIRGQNKYLTTKKEKK